MGEQIGLSNRYVYLNYVATWQDPVDRYGVTVKSELREVSEKYDPEGVFRNRYLVGLSSLLDRSRDWGRGQRKGWLSDHLEGGRGGRRLANRMDSREEFRAAEDQDQVQYIRAYTLIGDGIISS